MMKKLLLIITFVGLGEGLLSQGLSIVEEQMVYKTIDTTSLIVDVFIPAQLNEKPRNAIVFFHGGGWAYGNVGEFHGACRRYAQKGFVTFSVEYRLSFDDDGKIPNPVITPVECVKDVRSAMRWVRKNASMFNIDPNRIVAGGQSVGGQLTLMTELGDSINEASDDLSISPRPNLMLLYSSTVNTVEAWCDYLLGEQSHMIWAISPRHNLRPGMPPAIAFHGLDDHTVKFWTLRRFARESTALGNEIEIVKYPGREHYLGEGNEKYSRLFDEEIMERTDQFLIKHDFMERE